MSASSWGVSTETGSVRACKVEEEEVVKCETLPLTTVAAPDAADAATNDDDDDEDDGVTAAVSSRSSTGNKLRAVNLGCDGGGCCS